MPEKSQHKHNPLLIFVRGIPGSGKTYFTQALHESLKGISVTVVDPDNIDVTDEKYVSFTQKLEADGLDKSLYPFRWLRQVSIEAAKKDAIIIWNQPFTKKDIFDRLIQFLKNAVTDKQGHELEIFIVELSTPKEVAWERVTTRKNDGGHGPDREVFEKRYKEYTSYKDNYPVLELNGEAPIDVLVAKTSEKIESLR